MEAAEISRSGLDVEWTRLRVVAENIANINSSGPANGKGYVARQLVSGPVEDFPATLDRMMREPMPARGVTVYGIEARRDGSKRVYAPNDPQADKQGFITEPNVSLATEMTEMLKAGRAYQANLVALSSAQDMYASALKIGGRA
ncbi:flagellar basal body rod protein FlgC [Novosphingobium beihaiensis]|uniref:Flagellar basal-body rod protein FlgC n=1 Tax=Novosphingobium beihaiensis TaxID=2930389 RepID=A0ABT0BQ51_9SPHN|nr:flagellar basal body rod protein FlgC [Novosphingobium beihaiensis]MCJ2186993.1 flagellar basal body rod protein FlgC [Novosphingobium beihaiensis]